MAGEMADTGTLPDSAPQYPLNTSGVSEVASIFESWRAACPQYLPRESTHPAAVGIDAIDTKGTTVNACSPRRPVVV